MLSRGRLGEVALAEGLDPLAEGLLGAGREQDHADVLRSAARPGAGRGRAGRRRRCRCRWRRGPSCASRCRPSPRPSRGRGRCRAWQSARRPVRAPSAARIGPPTTGAISGGLVSCPSIRPRRSASLGISGWKIRPEWAASWWATITIVRSASAGPSSQSDVVGGALAPAALRRRRLPGREVVGDAGGADRAEDRAEPAPAAQAEQSRRARPAPRPVPAATSRCRAPAQPRSAPRRRARQSARRSTPPPRARLRKPTADRSARAPRASSRSWSWSTCIARTYTGRSGGGGTSCTFSSGASGGSPTATPPKKLSGTPTGSPRTIDPCSAANRSPSSTSAGSASRSTGPGSSSSSW